MNNENRNQILNELVVSNIEDEHDGDFSAGDLSLREAIANAEDGSNFSNSSTDRRGEGFDRTIGDGTDIGAFELQAVANLQITRTIWY